MTTRKMPIMTLTEAVNIIRDVLLTRQGDVVTEELALERARNIVAALDLQRFALVSEEKINETSTET